MSADANATEHTVTAGRARRCEGYRCGQHVKAGEDYVRLVAFPGHDAIGYGETRPWVLRICVDCWREYDAERPMPPRRTRRRLRAEAGRVSTDLVFWVGCLIWAAGLVTVMAVGRS